MATISAIARMAKWPISVVVTVACLLAVEHYIGWRQLITPWQQLPWHTLILLIALSSLSHVARALRIINAFTRLDRTDFSGILLLSALHIWMNNLLPMRSGEASFPLLLKQQFSIGYTESTTQLICFRVLDLCMLLLITGLVVVGTYSILLALLLLALSVVAFAAASALQSALVRLLSRLTDQANKGKASKLTSLLNALSSLPLHGRSYINVLAFTALIWACKLTAFILLIVTLADLNLASASLGVLGAELSSILPIHGFAGIGSYQAGFVLFTQLTEEVIAEALRASIVLHLFMFSMSTLIIPFAWLLSRWHTNRH